MSFTSQEMSSDSLVEVSGRRFRHLKTVLKLKKGDELRLGMIGGRIGRGQIIDESQESCHIQFVLDRNPPVPLPVHLILALPRPKSLPRILHLATNMGVKEITFINTWRVEKPFWSSDYLDQASVEKACRLGLEQAVDTIMPKVNFERRFRPYVEDRLPQICARTCNYLAHPYSQALNQNQILAEIESHQKFCLALGPEGGFIPFEVECLRKAGFRPFSFSQRVLKLEAALPALLSQFTHS